MSSKTNTTLQACHHPLRHGDAGPGAKVPF